MSDSREISVLLDGPRTRNHRLPLDDYLRVGRHLQIAIKRAGLAVGGADQRASKQGRLPKDIERACSLEVGVPIAGSFGAVFHLPEPSPSLQLFGDIGMIATSQVLEATNEALAGRGWPASVGSDVHAEMAELVRVLEHGVTTVSITFNGLSSVLTRQSARAISDGLDAERAPSEAVVVGRLMETDYHDKTLEIHVAAGPFIRGHYEDDIERDVHMLAKKLVSATGWAKRDPAGRITHFDVRALSPIEPLVPVQVLRPPTGAVYSPDELFGGYPDHRDASEILADLAELRRGSGSVSAN